MKRISALLAATVAISIIAVGQNGGDIRKSAESAIRAADEAGLKAAHAKDIEGATANYAADAAWLPPNAPAVQGKEAIRAEWAKLLGIPGLDIDWQITKLQVSASGEMAYALYSYQMTIPGPNGSIIHDHGKDMAVWKKSDGVWKMVADTFNSDLPVPSK